MHSVNLFQLTVFLEAATKSGLYKKVFLEISHNSQENTCARASLPPRKIAPLTPTLTLTRGTIYSEAIVWLTSNPKTNTLALTQTLILTGGQFSSRDNCRIP